MSPRTRSYVGPRAFRVITYAVGLVGAVAALVGPAYAINGATQASGYVTVFATVREGRFGADATPTPQEGVVVSVSPLPEGVRVEDDLDVTLRAWDSTVTEQLLARGDAAVLGLAVGLAALVLVPLLRSVAAGRPFEHGNARRLAFVAALVGVNGLLAPLLPAAATVLVLERTGADVEGVFEEGVTFDLLPIAAVAALLVLAEAFRRGEQIADDVEGLV